MASEEPSLEQEPGERWIAIGRLLRPQGRRGEILSEPLTDLPDVFVKGRQVRLATSQEAAAQPRQPRWKIVGVHRAAMLDASF